MALSEIWTTVFGVGGAGAVILILGLIKIKPLEISVWSWIARKIGKSLNGETLDKINKLESTLKEHLEQEKKKEALMCRQRILRFADEMYEGRYHSKEHFEEMLEQIDFYLDFCRDHPDFPNGKTISSIRLIRDQYDECLQKRTFEMKENQ